MHDYQADPWLDFHDVARGKLAEQGLFYERKPVKNTNFGLIYGMGVGKLAEKNGTTVDEAKDLKAAILKLYPGSERNVLRHATPHATGFTNQNVGRP